MAKRRRRKHEVRATIQVVQLTKAGSSIEFEVFSDGEKLGQIVIGRGSLTWYGGRRRNYGEFSWSRFAEIMNKEAYGES